MGHPNVTRPGEIEYYKPSLYPGYVRDYDHVTHDDLVQDVKVAHKFIRNLVTEKSDLQLRVRNLVFKNDNLQKQSVDQARELIRERKHRQALWTTIAFMGLAFIAVIRWMIPYVVQGIINGR